MGKQGVQIKELLTDIWDPPMKQAQQLASEYCKTAAILCHRRQRFPSSGNKIRPLHQRILGYRVGGVRHDAKGACSVTAIKNYNTTVRY
ncbi:hypothetical protein FHS40_008181 [Streptomyces spectabilis]|uniref:Uncharacterized protein n=1 Tax=Streptomyces spectabilis TaxID=68270 RepID=A0A7W8B4H6_STRST|nr:hypothetical protein [Streptomyces spectabilis]MBB5109055.1 hypothetical protein [Streptomyces spectabilis]MCI3902698.1 hypothetical protein [Streptomyces spectabilis]